MIYFLLIAILVMTGWIMITLNEIDRTNIEERNRLERKLLNLQNGQDGVAWNVKSLKTTLVPTLDEEIDEFRKEMEEKYKDD